MNEDGAGETRRSEDEIERIAKLRLRPNLRISLDHTPLVVTPGKHRIVYKGVRCYNSKGNLIYSSSSDFIGRSHDSNQRERNGVVYESELSPAVFSVASVSTAQTSNATTPNNAGAGSLQEEEEHDMKSKLSSCSSLSKPNLPPRPYARANQMSRTLLSKKINQSDSDLSQVFSRRLSLSSVGTKARSEGQESFRKSLELSPDSARPSTIDEKASEEEADIEERSYKSIPMPKETATVNSEVIHHRTNKSSIDYRRVSTKSLTVLQGKQISQIYSHRYSSDRSSDSLSANQNLPRAVESNATSGCFPSIKRSSIFPFWLCTTRSRNASESSSSRSSKRRLNHIDNIEAEGTVVTVVKKHSLPNRESRNGPTETENSINFASAATEQRYANTSTTRYAAAGSIDADHVKQQPLPPNRARGNSTMTRIQSESRIFSSHHKRKQSTYRLDIERSQSWLLDGSVGRADGNREVLEHGSFHQGEKKGGREKHVQESSTDISSESIDDRLAISDSRKNLIVRVVSPSSSRTSRENARMSHLKRVSSVQGRKFIS